LIGVGLGPALLATWRATRLGDGHGTIEAGFNNGTLNYTVIEDGVKTFVASTPFSMATLWVVGPPLLLWVAWLLLRRRPNDRDSLAAGPDRAGALGAGSGGAEDWVVKAKDQVRADRNR
jgi:hypothetical protein